VYSKNASVGPAFSSGGQAILLVFLFLIILGKEGDTSLPVNYVCLYK